MTLMPDNDRSRGTSSYPEHVNYALYELIWALGLVMVCLCAAAALISHT